MQGGNCSPLQDGLGVIKEELILIKNYAWDGLTDM